MRTALQLYERRLPAAPLRRRVPLALGAAPSLRPGRAASPRAAAGGTEPEGSTLSSLDRLLGATELAGPPAAGGGDLPAAAPDQQTAAPRAAVSAAARARARRHRKPRKLHACPRPSLQCAQAARSRGRTPMARRVQCAACPRGGGLSAQSPAASRRAALPRRSRGCSSRQSAAVTFRAWWSRARGPTSALPCTTWFWW
jgi:hypothetical protein